MRHKVNGRKFDRNTGARKAIFRNLITQFFKYDRIVTTEAKAKEVRKIAEKLITKAKREDLHARRQVLRIVTDKSVVKRLFDIILAKVSDRNKGGYTRIIKIGNRKGDDAPMALLEILEPGSSHIKTRKSSKRKASSKTKSKVKKEKAQTKTVPPQKVIQKKPGEKPVTQDTEPEEVSTSESSSDIVEKPDEKVIQNSSEMQRTAREPSSEEKTSDMETKTQETEDHKETS